MKIDEREIERVLRKLYRVKAAVIDSSSIIYLHKSGFLHHLAGAIQLLTIPQVIEETGMAFLPVTVVDPFSTPDNAETDRLLFTTAAHMNKAVISEDRAILLKCEAEGVEYYNAYNMLIMLRLRGLVSEDEFLLREEKLLSVAHYGRFVIDYVESLRLYMRKLL